MALWRTMTVTDVKDVLRLADLVHPDLPESEAVFAERMELFPEGCLVLVESDKICGYAISHPIRHQQPPALDSLLGEIAPDADQFYIHDIAILREFRGRGLAETCIRKLFAVARRYSTTCLISVYGTAPFWGRFGFEPEKVDAVLWDKLLNYGNDAIYLSRKND